MPPSPSKHGRKPALAFLLLGSLALGLGSCGSRPKPPPAKVSHSDNELNCADENAKPNVRCAKNPAAAFDPAGLLWVAWSQNGKLYVSHSNDLGKSFSQSVAVTPTPEAFEDNGRPRIVATKSKAVHVAWTQNGGQVRYSRSLDAGRTFTAPVTISNGAAGNRLGSMAVNSRDHVFLAWTGGMGGVSTQQGGTPRHSGANLYYTYSKDGGRRFLPEQEITGQACECCQVGLKVDPKQLPVLLWREASGVALNHFLAKDRPGPVQMIGEGHGKAEGCEGAALSVAPTNGYFATWASEKGLFFSSSLDQGKNFTPPALIGQSASATDPDILADDRAVHLLWKQAEGSKSVLTAQNSWDGGQTWSPPKRLAEAEDDTGEPFLLADQSRHYAVWQTKGQGFRLIPLGD